MLTTVVPQWGGPMTSVLNGQGPPSADQPPLRKQTASSHHHRHHAHAMFP